MNAIPKLVPISELRLKQAEVLASLDEGPVILTQHSRGAAVLMGIDYYNRLLAMIEDLQDALDQSNRARTLAASPSANI